MAGQRNTLGGYNGLPGAAKSLPALASFSLFLEFRIKNVHSIGQLPWMQHFAERAGHDVQHQVLGVRDGLECRQPIGSEEISISPLSSGR